MKLQKKDLITTLTFQVQAQVLAILLVMIYYGICPES